MNLDDEIEVLPVDLKIEKIKVGEHYHDNGHPGSPIHIARVHWLYRPVLPVKDRRERASAKTEKDDTKYIIDAAQPPPQEQSS